MPKQVLIYEKPTTASLRGVVKLSRSHLWKGDPEKSLCKKIKNTGGRNNRGVITCAGRVNVEKRKLRIIDTKRNKDARGTVERIEYDPNRTAHIALIKNEDGTKHYILATENMEPGMIVASGSKADKLEGHSLTLFNIDVGTKIHNLESKPGKGGDVILSAGCFATLVGKQEGYAEIRLPSKETKKFPLGCRATIGIVSNGAKINVKHGKAGKTWYGLKRRPKGRGIAKNPVDHAMGGNGNGGLSRNSVGGALKGKKTRKRNKPSDKFIINRRNRSKA